MSFKVTSTKEISLELFSNAWRTIRWKWIEEKNWELGFDTTSTKESLIQIQISDMKSRNYSKTLCWHIEIQVELVTNWDSLVFYWNTCSLTLTLNCTSLFQLQEWDYDCHIPTSTFDSLLRHSWPYQTNKTRKSRALRYELKCFQLIIREKQKPRESPYQNNYRQCPATQRPLLIGLPLLCAWFGIFDHGNKAKFL